MKPSNGTNKKNGFSIKSFSPLDICTIGYILFSSIYMYLGKNALENMLPHYVIRVGILLLIGLLIWLNNNYKNNFFLFIKSIYPLFFLGFFYAETSYMKNIYFLKNLDVFVSEFEQWLWKCQPSIEFSKTMAQIWFSELMNLCYFSYYLITTIVCIGIFFLNRKKSYRSIFIVVFSFYLYYGIYDIFPIVGPQYYFQSILHDNPPLHFFGKLMHHILTNFEQPTGAFPSSHVGIAVILSYISFKYLKLFFYISLPFVIGICFATVYLKAHYLVDVIAGLISVPIFIAISSWVYDSFRTIGFQNEPS